MENGWLRFSHQLNFVRTIQPIIDKQHLEILQETLQLVFNKLETANNLLQSLLRDSQRANTATKVKYVWKKKSLDKAIEDFETWQRIADQSRFLLMRIGNPRGEMASSRDT